ncbi:MAG: GNAT family N-acetyltransferase [Ignavibacteria bacterium]|jgi:GNAT superfamily N-acetyltransferase|nr:GNAT family N-acetyltransferase [Ignavibacteria bacterium]
MEIVRFTENDPVEELTDLLHASYKRLADMGLKFVATYQTAEYTKNFIKNGECFVIKNEEDKIIATVMYYNSAFMKEEDTPEWYLKDEVAYFGKFAVHPDLQCKGIGGKMMDFLEEYAKSKSKTELALDTSEKALHLIEYYEKKGYRFIHHHQWDVTNYRSVIMSKKLTA